MKSDPSIRASITLLPSLARGRKTGRFSYRPHIVIGPTNQRTAILEGNVIKEEYLGVVFLDEEVTIEPGQTLEAWLALMYYHPQEFPYSSVVPGATFTIREGATIVGFGTVLERAQQTTQERRAQENARAS